MFCAKIVVMQALVFLAVLTVVVLIHEVGHFLSAKLFDIKVEEFGFGLPPRMVRLFRKGETEYTLNWLPIGGFVKMFGEDGLEREVEDERAFSSKTIGQRAVVLTAGVVGNFLLAVVLFAVVYSVLGIPTDIEGAKVVELAEQGPAMEAGLKEEMVIKQVVIGDEEVAVKGVEDLVNQVDKHKGEVVGLKIEQGEVFEVEVRENPPEGEGAMGVVIVDSELEDEYVWWQRPFRGVWVGFKEAVGWGAEIVVGLKDLVGKLVSGEGIKADQVAGPVGIYQVTGKVSRMGIWALLQFVGVFSVNLAILNLLPFPALDGGRVLLLGVELVRGKKLEARVEQWVNAVGMIVILGLMAAVTLNDVVRLLGGWEGLLAKLWWWS